MSPSEDQTHISVGIVQDRKSLLDITTRRSGQKTLTSPLYNDLHRKAELPTEYRSHFTDIRDLLDSLLKYYKISQTSN